MKVLKLLDYLVFFLFSVVIFISDTSANRLFFGWIDFISYAYARIEFNITLIIEGIFCLILSIICINTASSYLITNQWKWRWSMMTILFTGLLFIIAVASIGLLKSYTYYLYE